MESKSMHEQNRKINAYKNLDGTAMPYRGEVKTFKLTP